MEAFGRLAGWVDDNGWASYDVCDVAAHPIFVWGKGLRAQGGARAVLAEPFYIAERRAKPVLRRLLRVRPRVFPQAVGLLARAYTKAFVATAEGSWAEKARMCLDWLERNALAGYAGPAWGQPYDWPSRILIPRDTPRTTVTTIVGHAFLDAYAAWGKAHHRDLALGARRFVAHDLHRHVDEDGDVCFSYTPIDDYTVHNANLLAAAFLARTLEIAPDAEVSELVRRSTRYTIKHQRSDGAWPYWGPPATPGKVDNYHTGFNLESLDEIERALRSADGVAEALDAGLRFYEAHLFDGPIPRMTERSRYPIDVQSCAQAIITFRAVAGQRPRYAEQAAVVVDWTREHMQDDTGFFYYRKWPRRTDRTAYMRWGQSWMMRALAMDAFLEMD